MRMIRPKIEAPTITIAEEQEEFLPVTAAVVCNPGYPPVRAQLQGEVLEVNTIVMAFAPTQAERDLIAAGEPIYLHMLTFMKPMHGVILSVGSNETAGMYGLEVEK